MRICNSHYAIILHGDPLVPHKSSHSVLMSHEVVFPLIIYSTTWVGTYNVMKIWLPALIKIYRPSSLPESYIVVVQERAKYVISD